MTITKEAVLAALGKVQEPDLGQDLVTLNMIRNLEITGDKVSFGIMLTTPACPFRGKIEKDAKTAVAAIAGVGGVVVISVVAGGTVIGDGGMRTAEWPVVGVLRESGGLPSGIGGVALRAIGRQV